LRTINHPDEVDDYVAVLFDEYADTENGNPQFGSVNAIMHAMGYRLTAQKLPSSNRAHK